MHKEEKKRTAAQNRALHKWFELVAKEMNENGITMRQTLQKFNLEAPATKHAVKEYLWRPLQEALLGKHSTADLLKQEEIDKIYDSLNKFFAEEMEMELPPFPSAEEQIFKQLEE